VPLLKTQILNKLQNCQIYVHSVTYQGNQRYVANNILTYYNDSNGVSTFNLTIDLTSDVYNIMVQGELNVKKANEIMYTPLFKGSVDACDIQRGVIGALIYKLGNDMVEKYTNYKFGCPIKKGYYFARMFPVPEIEYLRKGLPPFLTKLLNESIFAEVIIKSKAKFNPKAKKWIPYFSGKGYGSLVI